MICLFLGFEHLVKLSVYWDEFSKDSGGFSQITIIVNTPPKLTSEYGGCMTTVSFQFLKVAY